MTKNYLENLDLACQELEKTEKYDNNKDNVFKYVLPIINEFNTIRETGDDELIYNSLALIMNIKEEKPELKGIVDAIIDIINEPIKEKPLRR